MNKKQQKHEMFLTYMAHAEAQKKKLPKKKRKQNLLQSVLSFKQPQFVHFVKENLSPQNWIHHFMSWRARH